MSAEGSGPGPTFTRALDRFKTGLTAEEISTFSGTTIEDVWGVAEGLQDDQSKRKCMQAWGRIEPFLTGLMKYSAVIEVFVQGKPEILAFIWGPVKLLLQIASNFANHFEKLLNALQSVGENLPRFIAYEKIFPNDVRLQEVVAMVYEDIMEFIRRIWKFFRRKSWYIFFDSLWNDFDTRFKSILENLKSHKELVDQEVLVSEIQEQDCARKSQDLKLNAIVDTLAREIQKAEDARKRAEEEFEKNEKRRLSTQRREIFKWINGIDPEDDKERFGCAQQHHPRTGLWLFERREFQSWLNGKSNVLWVTGIPGCGKTVLASAMIDYLQNPQRKLQVLYFFFSFRNMSQNNLHELLRAYISQYLKLNSDLLPVVADTWLNKSSQTVASLKALATHFKDILLTYTDPEPIYLILDGLDECDDAEQLTIQRYLHQTLKEVTRNGKLHLVRLCVISREIKLEKGFNKLVNPKVRIGKTDNKVDISHYITSELKQVKEELEPYIILTDDYIRKLTETLSLRAEGMFLWVRLVIRGFLHATRLEDIEEGVGNLPDGLDQAYGRILCQLQRLSAHANNKRYQETLKILKWLACACRPVTLSEVKSWLAVDVPSSKHIGRPSIVEGSLLTEILPDSTIQFVHFSAKEYILAGNGGNLHASPFLRPIDAHLNAFQVCITYLNMDFFNLDTSTADEMIQLRHLLNGDYHLLSYCNSYWMYHLRECLRLRPDGTTMKGIVELLPEFLQARKADITTNIIPAIKLKQAMGSLALLETAGVVDNDILAIIFAVVSHDSKLDTKYKENMSIQDLHTWHRNHHPLILVERFWHIQSLLERCMAGQAMGITPTDLDNLKQLYDRGIYLCRHPACEDHTELKGFFSSGEREDHESRHSRLFVCTHPSCSHGYAVVGFPTKSGLNKHLRNFHRDAGDDGSVNLALLDYILSNDKYSRDREEGRAAAEGSVSRLDFASNPSEGGSSEVVINALVQVQMQDDTSTPEEKPQTSPHPQLTPSALSEASLAGVQEKLGLVSEPKAEGPGYVCLIMGERCMLMRRRPNQRFKNATQVREDILRHWGLFQCPICFTRFGTANDLEWHTRNTQECQYQFGNPKLTEDVGVFVQKLQNARDMIEIEEAIKGWQKVIPNPFWKHKNSSQYIL